MLDYKAATLDFFKGIREKYADSRTVEWIGRNKKDNSKVIFLLEKNTRTVKITKEKDILDEFDIDCVQEVEKILKLYEVAYIKEYIKYTVPIKESPFLKNVAS